MDSVGKSVSTAVLEMFETVWLGSEQGSGNEEELERG
jgi:hypothetical protein